MTVSYTAAYEAAATYPMTHAVIMHTSLSGTITTTTAADGYAGTNAADPATYNYWIPDAPYSEWQINFASAQTVDCVSIAAHTLSGIAITVQTWNGSSWDVQYSVTPASNAALMYLFAAVSTTSVKITIGDGTPRVGVIYVGQALQMQRMAFTAVGLADLKRQTAYTSNLSDGGHFLGRSIRQVSNVASYTFENLTDAWYRANFDAVSLAARVRPFFIAARPDGYASDVAYGWVSNDIQPQRMGIKDFLSVQFDLTAYAEAV